MKEILIAAAVYVVPTFALGFVWHMQLFDARYKALQVYRDNVSPPLGLSSMVIQAFAFALIYQAMIAPMDAEWTAKAATYAALGGVLSWSFTTVAWLAKARITGFAQFFALETGYTVVQWVLVGAATASLV